MNEELDKKLETLDTAMDKLCEDFYLFKAHYKETQTRKNIPADVTKALLDYRLKRETEKAIYWKAKFDLLKDDMEKLLGNHHE